MDNFNFSECAPFTLFVSDFIVLFPWQGAMVVKSDASPPLPPPGVKQATLRETAMARRRVAILKGKVVAKRSLAR